MRAIRFRGKNAGNEWLYGSVIIDEFPCNAPTQEWAEIVGNIHDNPEMIK